MPIPLPKLDDHDYDDLVDEARALIPVLLPEWTDHNPSDPGITLMEVLAWLTEMQLFALDQITDETTLAFLHLLGRPDRSPPADGDLAAATRTTLGALRERYRATTPDDYEFLVRTTWTDTAEAAPYPALRRVRCVPGRDLRTTDGPSAAAHVSVVVLPAGDAGSHPEPNEDLRAAIEAFLEPRRLLTVRHHVVGPDYLDVAVSANLALRKDAPPEAALDDAVARLRAFFDPFDGGNDGAGWEFGRAAHVSEVYAVLERTPLVDYIEDVVLSFPAAGQGSGTFDVHQLPRLSDVRLVGYDPFGRVHPRTWEISS